jgi:hypothetical protein
MVPLFILTGPGVLSCSRVDIKDATFWGNKGMQGAVEFHTLKPGKVNVSFEDWMKLIRTKPLVCTSPDSFGDMKKAVGQLCSACNCCDYETTKKFDRFFENVDNIKGAIK